MSRRISAIWPAALGLIVILLVAAFFVRRKSTSLAVPTSKPRVIVLGIDGMDYGITKSLMEQGRLPNFASLAKSGSFVPLQTSMPPLSPVAWSSFISGMNPGGHGVYDFISRDVVVGKDTPLLSDAVTGTTSRKGDDWTIPFTDFVWPSLPQSVLLRKGPTLWRLLENQGIACTIYKAPANYPVETTGAAALAGMGTPDIEGTYGMFTYLTSRDSDPVGDLRGGRAFRVEVGDGKVELRQNGNNAVGPFITGPSNPFRRNGETAEARQVVVPFDVRVDANEQSCAISLQGHDTVIKRSEWSGWVPVSFSLLPGVKSVEGRVRFYLVSAAPEFRLFVSAVNLAPGTEGLASGSLDRILEDELGSFYTKGMPEETKAVGQGVLDTEAYLRQSELVFGEGRRALDSILSSSKTGFQFIYFSTLDMNCHVMWKFTDPQHPATQPFSSNAYASSLTDLYIEMDKTIGRTLATLNATDILYVISDHGFGPLYREFNVNAWLVENGYLAYKNLKSSRHDPPGLEDIDWSQTRAYSMGFQSLYINRQGRERAGIVPPTAADALAREIRDKLLTYRDPSGRLRRGLPVFHKVYLPQEIYTGDQLGSAPDLILGYSRGYGPSDDSVLGLSAPSPLADHVRGFSGHHSFDFSLVPGVLFCNKQIPVDAARLEDVTATILADFGVSSGSGMTGRALR